MNPTAPSRSKSASSTSPDESTAPPLMQPSIPRPIHRRPRRIISLPPSPPMRQSVSTLPSPPTQQSVPRTPLRETVSDSPPPPASYPLKNLVYVLLPHCRKRPLASTALSSDTSDSESTNDHPHSTWVQDKSHLSFLLNAQDYLINVPRDSTWKELLSKYVEFEKLGPLVSIFQNFSFSGLIYFQTQVGLSTTSHPGQVSWWFRHGRRSFKKIPEISSLPAYKESWATWWMSLQPDWRSGGWPLHCSLSPVGLWNKILVGGKDGLFVVVMSLSWWIIKNAEDKREDSKLEEATADVSWVLSNLVSVLSAGDDEQPSLSSPPPLPTASPVLVSASPGGSQLQSQHATKVGSPNKRSRLR